MAMVYDSLPIKDHNDPLIVRVNDLVQRLVKAAYPGEHLVEFFPWMQRLPNWLAPWKPWAEEWHRKDSEMFLQYYKEVRDRVVRVIASEQYMGDLNSKTIARGGSSSESGFESGQACQGK
jgi:hypothetical protein